MSSDWPHHIQNDTYYNNTDGQYYNNNSYDYNNLSRFNYNQNRGGQYDQNDQGYEAASRRLSPVLNFRPQNTQNVMPTSGSGIGMLSGVPRHSLKGAFFDYNVIRNNNNEDWI